jgi:hypothetical protein
MAIRHQCRIACTVLCGYSHPVSNSHSVKNISPNTQCICTGPNLNRNLLEKEARETGQLPFEITCRMREMRETKKSHKSHKLGVFINA